jgi:uncharacterized protein YyaL (SSP411 family)
MLILMTNRFRLFLTALVLISWSLYTAADEISMLELSKLQKPPQANVSDTQFSSWQQTFGNKKTQLEQLLKDAGIDVDKVSFLNGLINNYSPYLLRHSVNPVNWVNSYHQALAMAKKRNQLIFLSIGYSTCHWCHVMEKESFLDTQVATVLNSNFINVKLDKEVDVELDRLFSHKQEFIKGESGWPLNAILTSDGKLFWTDAYVSKPDLLNTLSRVSMLWQQKPEHIVQVASNLDIQFKAEPKSEPAIWDEKLLNQRLDQIANQLDESYGGLKGDLKFPNAALLQLMLYQYQLNPTAELEKNIRLFLDNMINSGFWDHLHGGFFRYAQSSNWQQPHFEKMLYNQALLISVYAKASLILNQPEYAEVVNQTVHFINRWMSAANGGFYSAIDADYQGKEGGYYLFSESELINVNDDWKAQYQWVKSHKSGMLQLYKSSLMTADSEDNPLIKLKALLPPPHIDKKVLTSWNALLVTGLLDAYVYVGEQRYKDLALKLLNYLLEQHIHERQLSRAVMTGTEFGKATSEDYAWLSHALLRAYIITQNPVLLDKANFFYQKGSELLSKNTHEINWVRDQEFISPLAVLTGVGKQLSSIVTQSKILAQIKESSRQQLNAVKQQVITESGDYFSSYQLLLKQKYPSFEPIQLFARGNGKVWFKPTKDGVLIEIKMAPGWHINSNKPLEKSLIATEISTTDGMPIHVTYPSSVTQTLGFSVQPLSLFEGNFSISVTKTDKTKGDKLILNVQACNEKLCLFPETILFKDY